MLNLFGLLLTVATAENSFGNVASSCSCPIDVDLVQQNTKLEETCCSFMNDISEITGIFYKTDKNNEIIPNSYKVRTNTTKKEIECCENCLKKCKKFCEIGDKIAESSYVSSNLENLSFIKVKDPNLYLGIKFNDKEYLIAINLNTVKTIQNIVFLIETSNKYKLARLFDNNISLDGLSFINKQISGIDTIDIKASDILITILQEGKSLFTLKNVIIGVLSYYIIGTIIVFVYFNIYTKSSP